jgi:hypothetical protein
MPPALYYRQSTATDIGAMAKRAGAKHLMLTHLIPPIGASAKAPGKFRAVRDFDPRSRRMGFSVYPGVTQLTAPVAKSHQLSRRIKPDQWLSPAEQLLRR